MQGSVLGGWSFHLLGDGRLVYVHNLAGWRIDRVEADIGRLTPGDHTLAMRFRAPAAELLVDGEVVGAGAVTARLEPVVAHRGRAHGRLVARPLPCRRGLHAAVRLHRVAPPRRHRRTRPYQEAQDPSHQKIKAIHYWPSNHNDRSGVRRGAVGGCLRAAMSSFFMPNMAAMARSARAGSSSVSSASQPAGTTCHEPVAVLQPAALALPSPPSVSLSQ